MADVRNSDSRVNTAKGSEPNAQNSELHPDTHPSGARIETLIQNNTRSNAKDEPVGGGRDEFNNDSLEAPSKEPALDGHRSTPETRADED